MGQGLDYQWGVVSYRTLSTHPLIPEVGREVQLSRKLLFYFFPLSLPFSHQPLILVECNLVGQATLRAMGVMFCTRKALTWWGALRLFSLELVGTVAISSV